MFIRRILGTGFTSRLKREFMLRCKGFTQKSTIK